MTFTGIETDILRELQRAIGREAMGRIADALECVSIFGTTRPPPPSRLRRYYIALWQMRKSP